ncbi:hypothetical protein ADINL_0040 [Nitrincola lacisaponensis]|uniref:Uncharacterized protein n=1 Tax=Nitrincola lacisaponensis TaxID=267850 RepID=A0A063Y8B9_9GAMM|nr:hypothetical protein [Nitrincola lacisaponensis]KDE41360.1 hypothetical protein ADINL_0040 [Nitrincola lacisaponensis]
MNRLALTARIEALELQTGCGGGDALHIYKACQALDLAAPEPLASESVADYLKRLSTETLADLVSAHD